MLDSRSCLFILCKMLCNYLSHTAHLSLPFSRGKQYMKDKFNPVPNLPFLLLKETTLNSFIWRLPENTSFFCVLLLQKKKKGTVLHLLFCNQCFLPNNLMFFNVNICCFTLFLCIASHHKDIPCFNHYPNGNG